MYHCRSPLRAAATQARSATTAAIRLVSRVDRKGDAPFAAARLRVHAGRYRLAVDRAKLANEASDLSRLSGLARKGSAWQSAPARSASCATASTMLKGPA